MNEILILGILAYVSGCAFHLPVLGRPVRWCFLCHLFGFFSDGD